MNIPQLYIDHNFAFQQLGYTCGPVTLLNILRQRGDKSRSEEELASLCNALPGTGTTNDALVGAAKSVGLAVVAQKANAALDDIERHIDEAHAVIVNYFYAFSDEGHYAQVAGYDDYALYLADPTAGYMRIRKEYFVNHWHSQAGDIVRWFAAVA